MRILYFDLDSLRPDHLGCYGYGRETSPNIDRLASEGVRFNNCYASDVPCMPSRTSLFSGRFGIHHGCVSHTGTRAEPYPEGPSRGFRSDWSRTSWMRMLRQAGMRTVTFSGFGERHAAWHWYAGFQEIHDTGHFGHEISDHVTPGVLGWLKANAASDDWFLHVNLWDIHVPYRTPESAGNRFAEVPVPEPWLTEEMLAEHQKLPGIRSARDALFLSHAKKRPDLNPTALSSLADVKQMLDGYDTGINYVDEHIGRILSALENLGVLQETAIIVSADHGECLGELTAYGGHCFADACTARVPLIIRWPGVTDRMAGKSDGGLRYHLDLAATVTDLVGGSIPDPWDAQSMAGALKGNDDTGRSRLVLSQLAQACQRSVAFREEGREHLYLRTYRSGFYLMPNELLFDLARDPHELHDLAASRPELVKKAASLLQDWSDVTLSEYPHEDPIRTVLAESPESGLERYVARLKETGRGECVDRVVRKVEEEQRQGNLNPGRQN